MKRVALVHGWGGSYAATWQADGWDEALRDAGFEPVGVDIAGHGPQGGPHDPRAYADLASDLAAKLPTGLHGAIGFSLGTKLLLELEARKPGAYGRLVLGGIGDNLFAPETAGPAIVAALRGETAEHPPQVAALLAYAAKSGSDPVCLAAVLERPGNPVLTESRLAAAQAPILIFNSTNDAVAQPDDRLRAALPGALYRQVDGPGHVALTADARFRDAAVAFLTD
ncbi:alpha/beta fold hydrolase [Rhodovulum sulfidophilum]|uniref:Alpha/beta hydrolase n=1 Tax=Rhodovulum sulfidophilum TaxID=35806 RepID=A0ABS1RY12_RHOSU|nr:alpha/beta fold hydrolase [Rhodovulum sulfidophilum]MBL3610966.1 alpha/beta hydrolase [Rhodovulum sulfidophilum]MCE8458320.1 alpha/beta hydrolase [Rhodovulum sulfidophilum]